MNREKGFTLLEVLITLVVFATVSIGIFSLLNQSLFTYDYARDKLLMTLGSTKYIYINWNLPPEETWGWKYLNDKNSYIQAYKVNKSPTGIYNIIRVKWDFKKDNSIISYVFYY